MTQGWIIFWWVMGTVAVVMVAAAIHRWRDEAWKAELYWPPLDRRRVRQDPRLPGRVASLVASTSLSGTTPGGGGNIPPVDRLARRRNTKRSGRRCRTTASIWMRWLRS